MKDELKKSGLDVHLVISNMIGAEGSCASLIDKGDFPILQDTAAIEAWTKSGVGKDDFVIYNSKGKVHAWLPYGGPVDTYLSAEPGYTNVKSAWTAAK